MRQVRTGGAVTWQVLFFLPGVAGFPRPRPQMTWVFQIFGTFCRIRQKGIIVGGSPEAKNIEKTLLQDYDDFFRFFCLRDF
jgi:hypothetical protein